MDEGTVQANSRARRYLGIVEEVHSRCKQRLVLWEEKESGDSGIQILVVVVLPRHLD